MKKIKDLVGKRFTRLVVVGFAGKRGKKILWNCLCDCGEIRIIQSGNLHNEHTKSCGCLNSDITTIRNTKHNLSNLKIYGIWSGIKARCYCKQHPFYHHYGGRGIFVCPEWIHDVNQFFKDMGPRPVGLSLDRIDNNGPYSKENCRWASKKQQSNNRRSNRILTFNGKSMTLTMWAEMIGMQPETVRQRLKIGWSVEEALTIPLKKYA